MSECNAEVEQTPDMELLNVGTPKEDANEQG